MKKLNFKSILIGLIIGIMITSITFADTQTIQAFYNNIKISLNGTILELKDVKGNTVEPFIYNGTTYLPVRAVAEVLGMEVKFNETTNTVELQTVTNAVYKNTSSLTNITTLEDALKLPPEEKQKWLKENADADGNIIIDGKKVNIYSGLSEDNLETDIVNKTTQTNKSTINTTSDGINLLKRTDTGEYIETGKPYVHKQDIIKKYKDKFDQFNEGKGFQFVIKQIDEKRFKLILTKNNQLILDNIPSFAEEYNFNIIPLDYYENNILPLLK